MLPDRHWQQRSTISKKSPSAEHGLLEAGRSDPETFRTTTQPRIVTSQGAEGLGPIARPAMPAAALARSTHVINQPVPVAEMLRILAKRLDMEAGSAGNEVRKLEPSRRDTPDPSWIEIDEPRLAAIARQVYAMRRARMRFIDSNLLGEPGWDILLDLFIHRAAGKRVPVTNACLGAAVPQTTALRWITLLQEAGLVRRRPSEVDRRSHYIELTDRGIKAVAACLDVAERESLPPQVAARPVERRAC